MATFLDIGILSHIRIVFVFLFMVALVYAVLLKTKILGENKTIAITISFSIAILFSLMGTSNQILDMILPAFSIFLIFGFVLVTMFVFMGGEADKIYGMFGDNPKTMGYWILIITILIFLGGFGKIFFDPGSDSAVSPTNQTIPNDNADKIEAGKGEAIDEIGENAFWDTLFHPKVLGFIAIMMIGTFTVMYMTRN